MRLIVFAVRPRRRGSKAMILERSLLELIAGVLAKGEARLSDSNAGSSVVCNNKT